MESMSDNFDPDDEKSSNVLEEDICFPCSFENKKYPAITYCPQCEEFLCKTCTEKHIIRKAFKDHEPIGIEKYKNTVDCNTYVCTVCKDESTNKVAESTCKICEEDLCKTCSDEHRKRKATKTHTLFPISDKIKRDLELSQIICTNCKEDGSEIKAEFYCAECEENLCVSCKKKHEIRKATKNHSLTSIREMANEKLSIQFTCDLCYEEQEVRPAEHFCDECAEYMCTDCSKKHQTRKATKSHKIKKCCPNEKYVCVQCQNTGENISAFYCSHCFYHFCQACSRTHNSTREIESHTMVITQSFLETTKETKQCTTCKIQKKDKNAVSFCKNCNGNMCAFCEKKHKSNELNDQHIVVQLFDKTSNLQSSCALCVRQGTDSPSEWFCRICDKYLCQKCKGMHSLQQATKDHKLENLEGFNRQKQPTPKIPCDICHNQNLDKPATMFCLICKENLCDVCTRIHQSQKATRQHEITHIEESTGNKNVKQLIDLLDTQLSNEKGRDEVGPFSVSSSHIMTKRITPGKPKVEDVCGDKITIEWDIPPHKNNILCYEIRYRKSGETNWQVTATDDSTTKTTVKDLQGQTKYEFKVRAVFENEEGPYGPVSDQITTKTPHPGKPMPIVVATDSISIKWTRPESGTQTIKSYDIRYRIVGEDNWKTTSTKTDEETVNVSGLKGSSKYEFQIRAIYEDSEGKYGPTSDHIETETSLAKQLKPFATIKAEKTKDGCPEILTLPVDVDEASINATAMSRKCIFGKEPQKGIPEKTIMVVGATGSGKSTLIDGMVNYILDVSWEDEFRYSLINLTQEEKEKEGNQALSQTEWITTYRMNYTDGVQIHYTLNIIDTPGFGDTRGIVRDKKITDQMRQLFSTKGTKGISTIDAICFVTQAPLGRLSPTQKYIFESILSLFGKDIAENIFILITFADGNTPPVIDALKAAEIPYVERFVFNNSALYASQNAEFAPMFWDMGKKSFYNFFKSLNAIKTKSLVMTAAVLKERNRLETTVQGLSPQIAEGLNTLETLRKTQRILKQHEDEIDANKDFEYEVTETHQRKVDLHGEYTTNCLTCNLTCHYPCGIPNDENKRGCSAIRGGNCTVCPKKCYWDKHKNNPYRFELYQKKVKKTYDELKKKYEAATGEAQSKKQIFKSLKNEFLQLRKKVGNMVQEVRRSLNRLSEIALKPNPLSDCDYIDLLIQSEEQEGKVGFAERVKMLRTLRKDAEQIQQVSDGSFEPWKDFDLSDLEDDEDDTETGSSHGYIKKTLFGKIATFIKGDNKKPKV